MRYRLSFKAIVMAAAMLAAWPAASVALEPKPAVGSYLAGRFAQNMDDWGAAAKFMAQALANDPDNRSLRQRMFILALADGRYDKAVEIAGSLSTDDAEHGGLAQLALIARDIRDGKYDLAGGRVRALPEDAYLRLVKPLLTAWTAVGVGVGSTEALAILEASPAVARVDSWKTVHAAMLSEVTGDTAAAARWYEKAALLADAASLRIADSVGSFLGRVGEPANSAVPTAGAVQPAIVSTPVRRLTVADGAAQSLFDVASALAQQDADDAALLLARLALYLRPDFSLARLLLGDLASDQGRYGDALALYREVMETANPRLTRAAWLRAVDSLQDLKQPNEALMEAGRFLGSNPEDAEGLVRLGDLRRAVADFDGAVEAYSGALSLMAQDHDRRWTVLYGRALAYDRLGDWPSAEADFLAALELNPKNAVLLNYLGYTWADKGIHLARARAMVEEAVAARPHDGYIVDSLGWVLFRLGDIDGAIRYLERAIVLEPLDPTINDHLGDVYWQAGRRLEAKFQWHRALKYAGEEDAELVLAVERKLKERAGSSRSANAEPMP